MDPEDLLVLGIRPAAKRGEHRSRHKYDSHQAVQPRATMRKTLHELLLSENETVFSCD
jgi:hypothetical protein